MSAYNNSGSDDSSILTGEEPELRTSPTDKKGLIGAENESAPILALS